MTAWAGAGVCSRSEAGGGSCLVRSSFGFTENRGVLATEHGAPVVRPVNRYTDTATLRPVLSRLIEGGTVRATGKGRGTRYAAGQGGLAASATLPGSRCPSMPGPARAG